MSREPIARSPIRILTRYFFSSFFRLSFLDDAGEESFKKGLISLLTGVVGAGLMITRLYVVKYRALGSPDSLAAIIAADQLFIIAAPMFITALVLALVVHSIFPDEIDFRTLMALPLERPTVFAAKFLALAAFLAIFVGGAIVGLTVPLTMIVSSRLIGAPLQAVLTLIGVGVVSCGFAVSLLVAIEGLIAIALPRSWMRFASICTQTTSIALLVVSVPFLLRMPGWWRVMIEPPAWLLAVPPAWFLGLNYWLLGDPHPRWGQLAFAAMAGTAVTSSIAIGCALMLYRRFDQTVLRPSMTQRQRRRRFRPRLLSSPPAHTAVRDFIATTIRRSGLHQLVVYSMIAFGVALTINRLLGAVGLRERWVALAVLGVPFTLMAGAVVGLRTALLIPTNVRAGWVFRFLEDADTRRHQLNAVRQALFVVGAVWPAVLSIPIHAMQFGWPKALTLAPLTLLFGWFFTEAACLDWRRIPFTCTLLFGKRGPAFTVALAIIVFGWFVFLAASLLNVARAGLIPWLLIALLVGPIGLALRHYRLQHWGGYPLEFEDYLPDGLETLRLTE